MKKLILTLAFCIAASATAIHAADNDTTACFTVNPPMSCVNCENKIKSNLRFEKGVKEIEASAKDAVVTIKFDKKKTSVDKLTKAFKKIGYEANTTSASTPKTCSKAGKCCEKKAEGSCCEKQQEKKSCCKKQ